MEKTVRDAQALVLRGLGWVEYVVGLADGDQSSGWMPPGTAGIQDVVNLHPDAVLPSGTWSIEDALRLVVLDAWGTIPGIHFDARPMLLDEDGTAMPVAEMLGLGPIGELRSVCRLALVKRDVRMQVWNDVEWSIAPQHFQTLWANWAESINAAALGQRLTAEEVAALRAELMERHAPAHSVAAPSAPSSATEWATVATERGTPEPLEEPFVQPPNDGPASPERSATLGGVGATLNSVLLQMHRAQQILDEGGKGAKSRALDVLGLRHG